ncbi:MAG TPA: glycosyltransferase family 1 protein [Candidatus Saccharimonadales bacterium]|jgi:glycosyltransferase involved in cell wall biosynthesis
MSKIVIDAREYTSTTGRYMFRLVQYLEKLENQDSSGHEYTILLKPKDMEVYPLYNPRFTKVACPHKEFTFDEQLGLLGQIKDLKPDLVHFGMVQQPIGYRGLTVTTMHDLTTVRFRNPAKNRLMFTAKQQVYKGVNQYVARKSAAILTPTHYVKQDIVNYTHISPDKVIVTHEAADLIPDTAEPVSAVAGKRFIMYLGRPLPHKNLGRLIDAFEKLKQTYPDLCLVLAGKTDPLYERHYSDVQRRRIPDVIFTGYVSEGQLRWLYENCQVYVFPALSEGFGLPGLEAMIHGAPVASSNATCLPEVYGEAAHYFDPLSVDDIARAVSDLLESPQIRSDMIEKGRAQAAKYSWQRMAEQTRSVYQSTLPDDVTC